MLTFGYYSVFDVLSNFRQSVVKGFDCCSMPDSSHRGQAEQSLNLIFSIGRAEMIFTNTWSCSVVSMKLLTYLLIHSP